MKKWILYFLALLLFTQIAIEVSSKQNGNYKISLERIHIGNQAILSALDSFICNHVDNDHDQVSIIFNDNNVVILMSTDKLFYNPSSRIIGYFCSNGTIVHVVGHNPLGNISCDRDSCISFIYHKMPPIVDGYKALVYRLQPDGGLVLLRSELEW